MPKPNENQPNGNEPEENGAGTPTPQDNGSNPPAGGGTEGGKTTDKHGEDAINLGHHNRLMAEKDAEIKKLTAQVESLTGEAKRGEDALKKITELETRLEDEKVSNALKLAGCVNEKAAKAVLADYEGDVGKLAEACPYLFGGNAEHKQAGSTGAKHHGAPGKDDEDGELDKIFGLK